MAWLKSVLVFSLSLMSNISASPILPAMRESPRTGSRSIPRQSNTTLIDVRDSPNQCWPANNLCWNQDLISCANRLQDSNHANELIVVNANQHKPICEENSCHIFGWADGAANTQSINYDIALGLYDMSNSCRTGSGYVGGYWHAWGNGYFKLLVWNQNNPWPAKRF